MTFLELVNQVLIRLRESETTSVNQSRYTKLIAALINDSKRAVEDATDWTALLSTVDVTTVDGTSDYAVTGTNERTTIFSVVDQTARRELNREPARDLIRKKLLNIDTGTATAWAIVGLDGSGQMQIRFYPTPNGAVTYSVNACIPGADLSAETDTVSIPTEPIILRAYAYAIKERGEDQGQSFGEALDNYRRSLSRFLVLNNSAKGGSGAWRVL